MRALATTLTSSRLFTYLAAATPGLRELLTVGKVWELAQHDRRTPGAQPYDLVVLDAPATGHGVAILEAPRTFADAARVGPVARQGGKIHAMLADPGRTAVVAVATPEEMPVNETLSLRAALAERMGLPLVLAIVNGVLPNRLTAADVQALDRVAPSAATRAALSQHARSSSQRAQVARLRRGLDGTPVRTLPYLFRSALDADDIASLGRKLR
jgi:anion-transporting  ArsA/GET3 family ATPase